MALLADLSGIVLPVFICAAIGLFWTRSGRSFDSKLLSLLVYKIAVPCLIVATFAKARLSPAAVAEVAVAALAIYLVTAAIAVVVLRAASQPLPAYLPSMIFPQVGSMGLPVCLFAFGDAGLGLGLALVYFTLGAIGTFTIGAAIASGRTSLWKLISEPAIWAAVIAVLIMVTDITLPKWVLDSTGLLGGMAFPLQLFALGGSLGRFRVTSLPKGMALSVFRVGLGFAIGFLVAGFFELDGLARAVVILQSTMPVAVSNYLFAVIYKREPEEVAGLVLISTALSFFTLPLLLVFLM